MSHVSCSEDEMVDVSCSEDEVGGFSCSEPEVDDYSCSDGELFECCVESEAENELGIKHDMLVDEEDNNQSPNRQDGPLYEGATITVSVSYLMLFYFAKKYNLTLEAFEHLLGIVRCHCPSENKCASSVYKLKSYFNKLFGEKSNNCNVLQYCSVCCNTINGGNKCATAGCKGQEIKPVSFYYGDLLPQIKKRMKGTCIRLINCPLSKWMESWGEDVCAITISLGPLTKRAPNLTSGCHCF